MPRNKNATSLDCYALVLERCCISAPPRAEMTTTNITERKKKMGNNKQTLKKKKMEDKLHNTMEFFVFLEEANKIPGLDFWFDGSFLVICYNDKLFYFNMEV